MLNNNHISYTTIEKSPLFEAIASHDLNQLKTLLGTGIDINQPSRFSGDTPLCYAIMKKDLSSVKILLKHGANPNQATSDENTPLSLAAITMQDLAITKVLLRHGANPNQIYSKSKKPLFDFAIKIGALDIAHELLKYGAKTDHFIKKHSKHLFHYSMPAIYMILASLPPEKRAALTRYYCNYFKTSTDLQNDFPELKKFFASPKGALAFLEIVASRNFLDITRQELIDIATQLHQSGLSSQDIANTADTMLPKAFRENFDDAFKQAYQNTLKIRAIDRYTLENGILNLSMLPQESSLSLTKEPVLPLPKELAESITLFALQLPLPTMRLLSDVIKEQLNTSPEQQSIAPQEAFSQKLIQHLRTEINEHKRVRLEEAKKVKSLLSTQSKKQRLHEKMMDDKIQSFQENFLKKKAEAANAQIQDTLKQETQEAADSAKVKEEKTFEAEIKRVSSSIQPAQPRTSTDGYSR